MTENLIIKFDYTKNELSEIADQYKGLEIYWLEDVETLEIVKKWKKELTQARNNIKDAWKKMRSEALIYQKKVIEVEKTYLEIIEEVEEPLKLQLENYKELERKKLMQKQLPERKELLMQLWFDNITDDELLEMNNDTFREYFNTRKEEKIIEDQRKIDEERERLAEETRKLDMEIKRQKEIANAKKEAEDKAMVDYEAKLKKQQEEQDKKLEEIKKELDKKEEVIVDDKEVDNKVEVMNTQQDNDLVLNDKEKIANDCIDFVNNLIEEVNNWDYHEDDDWNNLAFKTVCLSVYPNFFKWFNKKIQ